MLEYFPLLDPAADLKEHLSELLLQLLIDAAAELEPEVTPIEALAA